MTSMLVAVGDVAPRLADRDRGVDVVLGVGRAVRQNRRASAAGLEHRALRQRRLRVGDKLHAGGRLRRQDVDRGHRRGRTADGDGEALDQAVLEASDRSQERRAPVYRRRVPPCRP
jgi:hypothetical protein